MPGCTHCPGNKPLTLSDSFTWTYVLGHLNILNQYVMCLQGTAAKILELSLGAQDFPSAAVAAEARVTRVFVELQFISRPWASGALRLIQLGGHDIDLFASWPAVLIVLLSGPLFSTLCGVLFVWYMLPSYSGCGAGHVWAVLWTRTKTLGLSLSAMLMLILCFFSGGGGLLVL